MRRISVRSRVGNFNCDSTISYPLIPHFTILPPLPPGILSEIKERCPEFRPKSVLDFGSGPGPSIAAAFSVWGDDKRDPAINDVLAVEPSAHMAQIGQYLLSDLNREMPATASSPDQAPLPGRPRIRWQSCLYEISAKKYDLITLSYVQMEIRGQPSRDMLVRNLWNRLNPGGMLVMVERGTPTGFRFMHHLREVFIEEIGVEHFHFVAPCPHEGMCPMAVTGRDWCHFGQRLMRIPHYIYCKGSRSRVIEEEKFSFLVVRKSAGPRYKYRSEKEAPTPAEQSYFWPRIVLPVLRAGGHAHIDVCSSGGNINARQALQRRKAEAESVTNGKDATDEAEPGEQKDDPSLFYKVPNGHFQRLSTSRSKAHNMGYRFSRQALWGDLWRFPKRITRTEARPYIPEETREHLDRLAEKAYKVGTRAGANKNKSDEPVGFADDGDQIPAAAPKKRRSKRVHAFLQRKK